jgi:hypothetical protein
VAALASGTVASAEIERDGGQSDMRFMFMMIALFLVALFVIDHLFAHGQYTASLLRFFRQGAFS